MSFNSVPILDWTTLKSSADDKINLIQKLKFLYGRLENILGKGENAGYQHFVFFPQCFQKLSIQGSLSSGSCCKNLTDRNMLYKIAININ